MSMFFGLKDGSWWINSKSDPRWNASGSGKVGLFGMPEEAEKEIKRLKKKYGKPPEDLEFGYMKD